MRQVSKHKRSRRLAVAVVLAVSVCLGILLSGLDGSSARAHAASQGNGRKVADDLRDQVNKSQPGGRVRVIVQPSGSWGGALDTALKGQNASVKASFKNFSARVV